MNYNELKNYLTNEDPVEQVQRKNHSHISDIATNNNSSIPKIPLDPFFKDGDIFVNKHHRFSYMPKHTHDFVELNYMFSGHSGQFINGQRVELYTHQILLMDQNVTQKIDYVGKNDILINILIKEDSILNSITNELISNNNLITNFISEASHENGNHDNFLVLNIQQNSAAEQFINDLIIKSLSKNMYRNQSMKLLLSLLLIELAQSDIVSGNVNSKSELTKILDYINFNYQSITLAKLGKKFSYNPNYLSNKLKQMTGNSFSELIIKKRISVAQDLLLNTTLPISEISKNIGYKNVPSFFKLFDKEFHLTPQQYRNKRKH